MWPRAAEVLPMILINLLPHREQKRRAAIVMLTKMAIVTSILSGLFVVALLFYLGAEAKVRIDYNSVLEEKIAQLNKDIATIDEIKKNIQELEKRIQSVQKLQTNRNNSVIFFQTLAKDTPEGIKILNATQDDNFITLQAVANNQDIISQYIGSFSNANSWYSTPELIEIRSVQMELTPKRPETVYAFSVRAARVSK